MSTLKQSQYQYILIIYYLLSFSVNNSLSFDLEYINHEHIRKENFLKQDLQAFQLNLLQQNQTIVTEDQSFNSTEKQPRNPIYFAEGTCSNKTCQNGICNDVNTCQCKSGYAQVNDSNGNQLCNYKLKKQWIAFLLELFFVIGIGHFYCGRIVNGTVKLSAVFLVVTVDFLIKFLFRAERYKMQRGWNFLIYFLYLLVIVWQVVDIVLFGVNYYNDYYDLPLWVLESSS